MKKKIIRLEDSYGSGVFNSGCILFSQYHEQFMDRHGSSFPAPFNDVGIRELFTEDHFCAYKSIDQMRQWVEPEELKAFIKLGIRVFMIDVIDCLEGEYQIVFKQEHIIKKENVTELFT